MVYKKLPNSRIKYKISYQVCDELDHLMQRFDRNNRRIAHIFQCKRLQFLVILPACLCHMNANDPSAEGLQHKKIVLHQKNQIKVYQSINY